MIPPIKHIESVIGIRDTSRIIVVGIQNEVSTFYSLPTTGVHIHLVIPPIKHIESVVGIRDT